MLSKQILHFYNSLFSPSPAFTCYGPVHCSELSPRGPEPVALSLSGPQRRHTATNNKDNKQLGGVGWGGGSAWGQGTLGTGITCSKAQTYKGPWNI